MCINNHQKPLKHYKNCHKTQVKFWWQPLHGTLLEVKGQPFSTLPLLGSIFKLSKWTNSNG